jgi:hypothetical protein
VSISLDAALGICLGFAKSNFYFENFLPRSVSMRKFAICPFCGNRVDRRFVLEVPDSMEPWSPWDSSFPVILYRVKCQDCGAKGPESMDPEMATRAWNGRVEDE